MPFNILNLDVSIAPVIVGNGWSGGAGVTDVYGEGHVRMLVPAGLPPGQGLTFLALAGGPLGVRLSNPESFVFVR